MSDSLLRPIVNLCRQARIDYARLTELFKQVRKALGLSRPARSCHLPKILPESSLRRFYEYIDKTGNLQHQIMLRLLFYTGIRVSELTRIAVDDIDLGQSKIFIASGKGDKDRYILFPESFALVLKAHLEGNPDNRYLFESQQRTKFSTRRVQQIVTQYAVEAGLTERVHPHLFRHQLLTWLTAHGMTDAQIQLISGHASKKSLEVYQHVGLESAAKPYQDAVRTIDI